MAQGDTQSNPVCTVNRVKPLCGKAVLGALITDEKADVTCPECLAVLGGAIRPVVERPGAPAPSAPRTLQGGYRQLVDSLNVEQLEAKKADLEGELAAVQVLLDAARAREKRLQEGAGGA